MLRVVELFEQPDEKLFVELVGALRIDDVDVEDVLSGRRPLEVLGVKCSVLYSRFWLKC